MLNTIIKLLLVVVAVSYLSGKPISDGLKSLWGAPTFISTDTVIRAHEATEIIGEFIAVNGSDEYIIATVNEAETIQRERHKEIFGQRVPGTKTIVNLNLKAAYKYYVKLRELSYTINGNEVLFNVPHLYLSKPVGFDSITYDCDNGLLGNCNKVYSQLMAQLPSDLEKIGESKFSTTYQTAAQALADNFHEFVVNNDKGLAVKTISVKFSSEDTNNNHVFHYSDNVFKSPL
jgi:hypothetical protein